MHPAEDPRYRRLLAIGQAGLGQVHRKHVNVAVQSLIHGPQVIQHPEIQGTAVIKAVGPEIHRRDLRQLAGIGFQHGAVGDFQQRSRCIDQIHGRCGTAIQRRLDGCWRECIDVPRAAAFFRQQQRRRSVLRPDDPKQLAPSVCAGFFRFPGHVPVSGAFLRPAGIAGAVCPPAPRQQAQGQHRRKQSLHENRLLFISTSLSAQTVILFPVLQIFPEIIIFLKFVLDILLSSYKISTRLEV